MSTRKWNGADVERLVKESTNWSEVMRGLSLATSGNTKKYIQKYCSDNDIDTSHFTGQRWAKGKKNVFKQGFEAIPLEEILVENSTYTWSRNLKNKLIAVGLKKSECESCGLSKWLGKPMPLQLDHVNGNRTDNRIDNLKILCPNCHCLTPTWGNKKRV
jgi:5-methylcytosine-specific restriction endonuclease McrA